MPRVLLCSDLLVASQLRGASTDLTTVRDGQQLLDLIDADTTSVLLDLTCPACDVHALVPAIRHRGNPQLQVIAFAPHVHVDRLEAARQAGCDQVRTRGQMMSPER